MITNELDCKHAEVCYKIREKNFSKKQFSTTSLKKLWENMIDSRNIQYLQKYSETKVIKRNRLHDRLLIQKFEG
jgi:hypothetical protein